MNFGQLKRSFKDAFRGLIYIFRYELSFRIQSVAAVFVLFLTFYFPLKVYERVAIILIITLVLVLELINSVLERIADLLQPRIDHAAKVIKDVMAGAVLLASAVSIVIAYIIFWPHLKNFFS